jgi:carbamoyltransferase
MLIIGLSAFYHDSAAVLIDDGKIVGAAQEERFTRKKHDPRFPRNALAWCIESSGFSWDNVDLVAFYDKPLRKATRLLETYVTSAPRGFASFAAALSSWIHDRSFQRSLIVRELKQFAPRIDWSSKLLFSEHHLSHAASAFFPSPFESAAILVADGVGEFATTSLFIGSRNRITLSKEIRFPHSLGLLYSAFTSYIGFRVNSGEYKLMGLAPYGEPKYIEIILDKLIDVKRDGSFKLNMNYFNYEVGFTMVNSQFCQLFGEPARYPKDPLTQFHSDVAASIQEVLDRILLAITRDIAEETGADNLCLAGGVALNCVSNGKILRDGRFKQLWIQPAAGDAGGALGAALVAHHHFLNKNRLIASSGVDSMRGSCLGPEFSQVEIEHRLTSMGATFEVLDDAQLLECCAGALANGQALGWFQGRMEFGPRALGNRSILADPRSPSIQTTLNMKVKKRESFRPFAPSVLLEDVGTYFSLGVESPYMLLVADIVDDQKLALPQNAVGLTGVAQLKLLRSLIPGVTHVDYSARIQTVRRETNPRYHALLCSFKRLTGCSVLVNTSFNIRGEPIVCTPEEAFRCFMTTDIDGLAVGNCYLSKKIQKADLATSLQAEFPPD